MASFYKQYKKIFPFNPNISIVGINHRDLVLVKTTEARGDDTCNYKFFYFKNCAILYPIALSLYPPLTTTDVAGEGWGGDGATPIFYKNDIARGYKRTSNMKS